MTLTFPATLTDNQVSSHYLILEQPPLYQGKPRIWQLVPEQDLARHAGLASGAAVRALTIRLLALNWRTAAGRRAWGKALHRSTRHRLTH